MKSTSLDPRALNSGSVNPERNIATTKQHSEIWSKLRETPAWKATGRFHAHLTIVGFETVSLKQIRQVAAEFQSKLTIIEMSAHSSKNGGLRELRDIMTTSYFVDEKSGAVSRIAVRLDRFAQALETLGVRVIRAKLEHESGPGIRHFSREHYHEVHIKTAMAESSHQRLRNELEPILDDSGFRMSQNPREQKAGTRIQFLNGRFYSGHFDSVTLNINQLLDQLKKIDLAVLEIKRETIVFDTSLSHDEWAFR